MKKFLQRCAVVCLILFVGIFAGVLYFDNNNVQISNAEQISASSEVDSNITYESIDNVIEISDKKVCNITETITVTFAEKYINLGLVRNVSRINKITRIVNGKKYVTKTLSTLKVLSVTMDDEDEYYFITKDNDYFYINTGADTDYKLGTHTYKFNYVYDMGADFIDDFDDFTFDIMNYYFRSPVKSFSAKVTLPKEFLGDKNIEDVLTLRTNELRPCDLIDLNFIQEGNTLNFSYGEISSFKGFTMQLILPNNYFDVHYTPSALYFIAFALVFAGIIALVVIILAVRKKNDCVVTPEFYAPKSFSPLDVARVYRGSIKPEDFASLVIDWAAKGYVSIENDDDTVTVTKLKDMPTPEKNMDKMYASKMAELKYFNSMFKDSDSFCPDVFHQYRWSSNRITDLMVDDEIDKQRDMLKKSVDGLYKIKATKSKKDSGNLFKGIVAVVAFVPLLLYTIWTSILNGNAATMFLCVLPMIAVLVQIFIASREKNFGWFFIIWSLFFGGVPLLVFGVMDDLVATYDLLWLRIIVLIYLIVCCIFVRFIRVIEKDQLEDYGKILGFKNFLLTAEKEKLEMLIEEDPKYFYNILPYCYVFKITKKMKEKFKDLHADIPTYWDDSSIYFSLGSSFITSVSPSSSSGGGFSGGGGGGGGGGSSGGGGGGGGCGGR